MLFRSTALAGPSGSAVSFLVIRGFVFTGIGGAAALPPDNGVPLPPRYGGAIAFPGGASGLSIEDCNFRQLGYAFSQRPIAGSSLAGTAISLNGANHVSVLRCDFSRLTTGIDFSTGSSPVGVSVSACLFHDAVVRPLKDRKSTRLNSSHT